MTYPTEEQYERWKDRAEEMDMSVSEFMQSMIEAGMKKFDATVVEPDETYLELREERNDLKDELEEAHERIDKLERQLYGGERRAVLEYVNENPGATYGEIQQHVIDTVPSRVSQVLDMLDGDAIRVEGDEYYPIEGGDLDG